MVMLILLVWRIGFGVTGMELVGVMPTVQGFVRCDAGSLWLVIIPKSKDWFMERPPMKTVQPRTGCAGKLRWQTTGMFGEAAMAELWDGVGKATMAGTHKAQEGASEWV
jgi:hypothetical protein